MEWIKLTDKRPAEGTIVNTKIDDSNGPRNHSKLKRIGTLWFVPDGSNYVYYKPTHWRPLFDHYIIDIFGERAKDCFTTDPIDDLNQARTVAGYWINQKGIDRLSCFKVLDNGSMELMFKMKFGEPF